MNSNWKPQQEIKFTVVEEAVYETKYSTLSAMITFCTRNAPTLKEQKILKEEVLKELKAMIYREELTQALKKITQEYDSVTSRLINQWREGSAVDDSHKSLLPDSIMTKLLLTVEYQAKIDEINAKINVHNEHMKKVFQNQSRLRENIKSLEKVQNSSLVDRYLKDLNLEEDDIKKTSKEVESAEAERDKLKEEQKTVRTNVQTEANKIYATVN